MKLIYILTGLLTLLGCNDQYLTPEGRKVISSDQLAQKITSGNPLYLKDYQITEDIDFTLMGDRYLIAKGMYECFIEVPVVFENCVFEGEVLGYSSGETAAMRTRFKLGISFEGCLFKEGVNFSNAVISGPAMWRKNIFQKDLNISGLNCGEVFSLNGSTVEVELKAHQSNFSAQADFFQLEVLGDVFFQGTSFRGDCILSNVKIHGSGDFSLLNFNANFFANYSEFNGTVWFNRSIWRGRSEFHNTRFEDKSHFKYTTFTTEPRFNGSSFAMPADTEGSKIYQFTSFQLTH